MEKELVTDLLSSILNLSEEKVVRSKSEKEEISIEIDNIKEKINHLEATFNLCEIPTVKEELNILITKEENKLCDNNNYLLRVEKEYSKLLENNRYLIEIIQKICPHYEVEYDYFDYHKGEDYNKCTCCGRVF